MRVSARHNRNTISPNTSARWPSLHGPVGQAIGRVTEVRQPWKGQDESGHCPDAGQGAGQETLSFCVSAASLSGVRGDSCRLCWTWPETASAGCVITWFD